MVPKSNGFTRRHFLRSSLVATAAGIVHGPQGLSARPQLASNRIRIDRDVEMKTRDGVILRADITRPDTQDKVPAIVCRTPYDKVRAGSAGAFLTPMQAATGGFAYVVQDVRGRYRSEGTWDFVGWGTVERTDGYDCIEWVASQPWCDGNVGMLGCSYEAGNQIAAAKTQPPHLKAIAPSGGAGGRDNVMRATMALESIVVSWSAGLAMDVLQKKLATGQASQQDLAKVRAVLADPAAAARTLPLKDLPTMQVPGMPSYSEMLNGLAKAADAYDGEEDRILAPALITSGWYDNALSTALFRALRGRGGSKAARSGTKTILGPWTHCRADYYLGECGFGISAGGDVTRAHLDFFSHNLLGATSPELPNVRYFVMGANVWKDAEDWPIPGTDYRPLYLHSQGGANTVKGNGVLAWQVPSNGDKPDCYRYDPADPVPSLGYRGFYSGGRMVPGPFDQERIESREDVLVYTSDPAKTPLEVVGDLELRLFISSDAVDTDFIVKVCDVDPNGVSLNVADGILRARFRNSWTKPELLKPGDVYEFRIDLGPTAYVFLPGHRVRLQVTSSAFPHWDRNMNTGHPAGEDAKGIVANQTIYHSAEAPSHLVLPVQPRKG